MKFKKELIIKDYEGAYDSYKRHESHIFTIRGWTITLIVAYLGFLITLNNFSNYFLILPVAILLFFFFLLESAERCYMSLTGDTMLRIEKIFMRQHRHR